MAHFFGHWVHLIVYPVYLGDKNAGVPGGKIFFCQEHSPGQKPEGNIDF